MTFLKEILLATITILGASGLIDFQNKNKEKRKLFSGRTYFYLFIALAVIFSLVEYKISRVEESDKIAFQDSLKSINNTINEKLLAFDEILYPLQPATLVVAINIDLTNPKFAPLASLISNEGFSSIGELQQDSLLKAFMGDNDLRAVGNLIFTPEFTIYFYKNEEKYSYFFSASLGKISLTNLSSSILTIRYDIEDPSIQYNESSNFFSSNDFSNKIGLVNIKFYDNLALNKNDVTISSLNLSLTKGTPRGFILTNPSISSFLKDSTYLASNPCFYASRDQTPLSIYVTKFKVRKYSSHLQGEISLDNWK